jgi:preprotein translocase subunit SecE
MKTAMIDTEAPSNLLGGWWGRARTFLTEVRNELKRVTWPTRSEVYATTFVVILTSAIFGVYLWVLDMVLSRVVAWLFRALGGA